MGLITINVSNRFEPGGPGIVGNCTFYEDDVERVRGQTGAVGVSQINAIVDETVCEVIIGVSEMNPDGSPKQFLDSEGNLVALSCPPFADVPAGQFPPT